MKYPIKIVSGGQTGVGSGAAELDAGLEIGLSIGSLAEYGQVPDKYPKDYKSRGTLIINIGPMVSGTALTAKIAQELNKPLLIIQLDQAYLTSAVIDWFKENQIQTLNIAGPRESKIPGIHEQAKAFLITVIK